jgi:hypothetical protein
LGLIYYATAYLCFRRRGRTWRGLFLFVLVLGAIRQFNLQVMLTESMQLEAQDAGWYEERRATQLVIIAGILLGAMIAVGGTLFLLKEQLAEIGVPIAGAAMLLALIAVRTTSHHYVDIILMNPTLGLRPAYLIELVGLSMIAVPAIIRRPKAMKMPARIIARIDSVEPP